MAYTETNGEEWRIVPSWPDYEASSLGNARRISGYIKNKGGSLKQQKGKPYKMVGVYRDKKLSKICVHRLVCEAFYGPCPEGRPAVAHGDCNHSNNRPDNLRWVSFAENSKDGINNGTIERGERHWSRRAKAQGEPGAYERRLSEEDVLHIRTSLLSYRVLARELGVAITTVRSAKLRLTWKHVI